MKDKEVPQDDANMMQGKSREPVYSLDENGNYTTIKIVGWEPKNAVMQQAQENSNEKVEKTREKVLRGELSPPGYFMEKNMKDSHLLAQYIGFWTWTLKKHPKPKSFCKLNNIIFNKYAEILDITTDDQRILHSARKKKKAMEKVVKFEHNKSAHCENGIISNLLRFYGIEISEPMALVLGSCLFSSPVT